MARPKRPRNHELESESQRAFESALPSSLVVRPVSDDYGVDREVEVFEDGQATGLTFKVQLKGTDGSGESQRVKRDSLNYWRDLDVPVLLVSYEARTRRLRSRWVHSIGLGDAESGPEKLTVRMRFDGEIDTAWADGIGDKLRVIRALKVGDVPNPLPVRVSVDKSLGTGSLSGLLAEMLQVSRRSSHQLRRGGDDEPALEFDVRDDLLRVWLPLDWASVTMHGSVKIETTADMRLLARDLMVVASMTVCAVNPRVAIDLAGAAGAEAAMWGTYEVATRIAPALAEHDPTLTLAIMGSLTQHSDDLVGGAADLYLLALHGHVGGLPDAEFEQWSHDREHHAERSIDAGRQLFNLGHVHRARRDWRNAKRLLERAATLDTRYASDRIWLESMGSIEWEVEAYASSGDRYRAALEAGAEPQRVAPLLADSLLFAGEYAAARDALATWSPAGEERDRVGVIRLIVLDYMRDIVSLDRQARRPPTAAQLQAVAQADDVDRVSMAVNLLRSTDALTPLLWDALTDRRDLGASFRPLLVAAVALIDVAAAWSASLLASLAAGEREEVVIALLNEGRLVCGDEFYEILQAAADEQPSESADYLRRLIATIYEQDPVTHGMTQRMVNPDTSATHWIEDEIWVGGLGAVPPKDV